MDAYDRCTNLQKKNLADSVAICVRGREIFRPPPAECQYTLQVLMKIEWRREDNETRNGVLAALYAVIEPSPLFYCDEVKDGPTLNSKGKDHGTESNISDWF